MRVPVLLLLLMTLSCQKAPPPVAHGPHAATDDVTPTAAPLDPEAEFADIRARQMPAVNDRVPRALGEKLKFAPQFDAHNRVVALVPESWQMGDAPGTLKPPADANLGASTTMAFGSACDGRCAAKDWAASFDKVEVHGTTVQQVESDEPIGNQGRVVVTRSGNVRYVVAGVWKPNAPRYFFCRAALEGQAIEALPAFVAACRAMDVRRWD